MGINQLRKRFRVYEIMMQEGDLTPNQYRAKCRFCLNDSFISGKISKLTMWRLAEEYRLGVLC